MAKYSVRILESAQAELVEIPFPFRRQVNQRIFKLMSAPRPEGAQAIGETDRYRLVVAGWRILYEIDDVGREIVIVGFRRVEDLA